MLPILLAQAVAGGSHPAEHVFVVIDHGGHVILGRAKGGEEGDEVILLGVAGPGVGGVFPVQHGVGAGLAGLAHGDGQPVVKGLGRHFGARPEQAQVVVAEAGADDQHTFVAQGSQGAAKGEMRLWRVAVLQRHLIDRHRGIGIHHIGGRKGAVVKALLGVKVGGQAGVTDQISGMLRQFGCTGGGIDDLVGFGREAAIVIDHRRMGRGHDGEIVLLPMARHHADRLGRGADFFGHAGK